MYDVDPCIALGQFTKKVAFRSRIIPHYQAQIILPFFLQPVPRELNWTIALDEFEELLACKRESADGPDGLPKKSVYRSAVGIGAKNKILRLPGHAAGNGSP